jgi:hypothetical protein
MEIILGAVFAVTVYVCIWSLRRLKRSAPDVPKPYIKGDHSDDNYKT